MQNSPGRSAAPVLYFPHGGGPLPLLGDPAHQPMVDFLKAITPRLGTPSSIVVISAHWEEPVVTVTSGPHPPLVYDYYGFPPESYEIRYPAPGDPALAADIHRLLQDHAIEARLDEQRGFDHGMFVPLKIMYPSANLPCVQVSLHADLDPRTHLEIGRALSDLRKRDLLIIGSGFSFHNLRAFFAPGGAIDRENDAFQQWLLETCIQASADDRERMLIEWEKAPYARLCHPREEHLLPLHVCCGVTGSPATVVFDGRLLGKRALGLLW